MEIKNQKRVNDLTLFTIVEKWKAEKIITDSAIDDFLDNTKANRAAAIDGTNYIKETIADINTDLPVVLELLHYTPITMETDLRDKLVASYGVISGKAELGDMSTINKMTILIQRLGYFNILEATALS